MRHGHAKKLFMSPTSRFIRQSSDRGKFGNLETHAKGKRVPILSDEKFKRGSERYFPPRNSPPHCQITYSRAETSSRSRPVEMHRRCILHRRGQIRQIVERKDNTAIAALFIPITLNRTGELTTHLGLSARGLFDRKGLRCAKCIPTRHSFYGYSAKCQNTRST